VALNMLRACNTRREQPLDVHVPDPVIDPVDGADPEHEAMLADSVGLAMLIVLETLSPAERLAFVLHDLFAVPFETSHPSSNEPRRRRASSPAGPGDGSRRRPSPTPTSRPSGRSSTPSWPPPLRRLAALVAVLDPDIELRADGGALAGLSHHIRGAQTVAQALLWSRVAGLTARRALVNGAAGAVSMRDGKPFSVAAITIRNGKIAEMDFLVDPERIARLDPSSPCSASSGAAESRTSDRCSSRARSAPRANRRAPVPGLHSVHAETGRPVTWTERSSEAGSRSLGKHGERPSPSSRRPTPTGRCNPRISSCSRRLRR
jgi:RNA polymerase sigma-70 factor (ECF subfamily)